MTVALISHDVLEAAEEFLVTSLSDTGTFLLNNPALAIFFCLGLGYLLGKVKIKSFVIGATVGTLAAGLLLSLVLSPAGAFKISGVVKTLFFSLFIFAIGYEVGPSFFASLKSSGLKIVGLSLFFIAVTFGAGYVILKLAGVTPGEAGGILAGAMTQLAILGTADATLKAALTGDALSAAESKMAVAYVLTYVFGTVGVLIFMKTVAPALMGVKLTDAVSRKITEVGFHEANRDSAIVSAVKGRAFRIDGGCALVGKSVEDVELAYDRRILVERVFRGERELSSDSCPALQAGDVICVVGDLSPMVSLEKLKLTELSDGRYVSFQLTQCDVILKKGFNAQLAGNLMKDGLFVVRSGAGDGAGRLRPGDMVTLAGPKAAIQKITKELGYARDTGIATDVAFLGTGLTAGLLIGSVCFVLSGIPITLGSGGGALIAGLVFGWYQNKHQRLGLIPASTRWFLKSVGLNVFIAIVGLTAGSKFLVALRQMGWQVLVYGAAVTLTPHFLTLLFGKYVMKMDLVDIIGTQCGVGTCTAALNGVIEQTGSSVFALSYTPGYAVGNILLTVLGPVIVALLM